MARGYETPTPIAKLDEAAARVLYVSLREYDSAITKQQQIIDNANLDIVAAIAKLETVYKERENLSAQLDKFAPDDFMAIGLTDTAAPAPSPFPPMPPAQPGTVHFGTRPWHRESPLPRRTYQNHEAIAAKAPAPYDEF